MSLAEEDEKAFWVPRRQLSLSQAQKRSDLVSLLRMLFITAAAISAGVFIGQLAYSMISHDDRINLDDTTGLVTMQNPRFTGRDANGVPYVITADTAQRNEVNPQLVELNNPAINDGATGTVRAPTGVFDQESQQLELFEDVVMTDLDGNRFETAHARMFIEENRVSGLQPLQGTGPMGRMRADSYEIKDNGSRIHFKGNVWTELAPVERPSPIDESEANDVAESDQ